MKNYNHALTIWRKRAHDQHSPAYPDASCSARMGNAWDDDDVEEEDNFYINCYKLPSSLESKQLDIGPPLRVATM